MTLAEKLQESQFTALDEAAAADILNTPDPSLPTKRVPVASKAALAVLLTRGKWGPIVIGADPSNTNNTLRALCITVRDACSPGLLDVLSTDNPAVYTVISGALEALVTAGLLVEDDKTALLALAEKPQSWAELNLGGPVDARAVGIARGAKE